MRIRKTIILILLITVNALSANANILGSEAVYYSQMQIAEGTYYNKNVFYSDQSGVGYQTEYFFEYTPNDKVIPAVLNGASLYGKRTITQLEEQLKNISINSHMVMNADFFSLSTGVPMSHLVIDNEIITKHADALSAIAFNYDGTAFISTFYVNTSIRIDEQEFPVYNVNKLPQPKSWYLMNSNFGDNTHSAKAATKVIIGSLSDKLLANGQITGVVEDIIHDSKATALPEGKLVLTLDDNSENTPKANELKNQLALFEVGKQVTINSTVHDDERFKTARYILGCFGGRLLDDGNVSIPDESAAPRTAIGIKADGTIVFYAIDGRQQGISYGVRLVTLANRLKEMGCVDAVNLDGGGSTSVTARMPGYNDYQVINSPSDGNLRAVANFVGLLNLTAKTGALSKLYLYPYSDHYLIGGKQQLTVMGVDENFYKADVYGDVNIWADEDKIEVEGNTVTFKQEGDIAVNANLGEITGSSTYVVHKTPEIITVLNQENAQALDNIVINTDESIDLTAKAALGHINLISSDESYIWAVEGNIGSIGQNGFFKAAPIAGNGRISVTAGENTKYINVSVLNENDPYQQNSYTKASFERIGNSVFLNLLNTERIPVNEEGISIKVDGKYAQCTFSQNQIQIELEDSKMHKITAYVINSLGQPSIFSYTAEGELEGGKFSDINGHWGEDTINYMSKLNIINGIMDKSELKFMPDDFMTRGQFSVMLYNYLGITEEDVYNLPVPYADLAKIPAWGIDAVKTMYQKGIITGREYDNGELQFDFTANITRAEAVTILKRLLPDNLLKKDLDFSDSASIPEYSVASFKTCLAQGFITGYDDGTIKSDSNVTRAEALKIIFNIF